MANKYIQKLSVGSETYLIKDQEARDQIATIVAGGVVFIGITTTTLTEGSTTNPITIEDATAPGGTKSVTAITGNLTIKRESGTATAEFIWDGSCWRQLGAGSTLKALAFKDSASGSYTPAGTVTSTLTGTAAAVSMDSYTPAGTVAAPVFTGTAATVSMAAYTPAGTVAAPVFTGTAATVSMNSYTPAGTCTKPDITLTDTLGTGESIAKYSVDEATETLKIGGVTLSAVLDEAPTFTGTAATLSGSYTPAGTLNAPAFTGTEATLSGSYTPAGTLNAPAFTGTAATLTGTATAAGTIVSTFAGTADTITVS